MTYDILVLAGGDAPEGLEQFTKYNTKATLDLCGRLMIEYVVDALKEAPGAGRILVVGNPDPLESVLGDRVWKVAPPGDTMLENLQKGVDAFPDSEWLLVASCDIPLITGDMVGRFAQACERSSGDIFATIIKKETFDAAYPTTKRTYGHFKEGKLTGGNIFMLKPPALLQNWHHIQDAIAARKSVLRLASLIGFWSIILFITRQLRIAQAEARVQHILGVEARTIPCRDAEIGVDVDKVVDYELVKSVLEKK